MEPQRFGDYVLLERVAVGGMAEVFRARLAREGGVQRQVCIKRVHPKHSADASFSAMFVDEARIGVTLSHGNIVPIFDFGCVDGLYYLAMEYVEGRDLAQIAGRARIARIDWPIELAVFLVLEILEGLDYAHERCDESGRPLCIVHRDVSPANVLVARRGDVKILDFGIARAESRELETRTGVVKGTPGYMAPEQAAGRRPDRRADLFAVGVLLWELARGARAPKDGSPVEPLSDPELWAVVSRAMAVEPEARFGSARFMADALRGVLAARAAHPSSRDLSSFVEQVFRAPAAAEDWQYRDGDLSDPPVAEARPSGASTAPERRGKRARPPGPEPTGRRTGPATENVDPAPASPTGFVARLRGQPRRRFVITSAAALLLTVLGLALASQGPARTPRPPRSSRPPEAVPRRGALHVVTLPAGARVELEDGRRALTPARFDELASGPHRLTVEREGYEPLVRGIAILAGETATIELPLSLRRASLRIECAPAGARIRVDGSDRGQCPATVAGLEPERPHRLDLELDGHEARRTEVTLAPGELQTIALRLRPLARGMLSVNVSDWAEVSLDGQRLGNTPLRRVPVAAGTHRLDLRNPHRRIERRLTVVIHPRTETRVSPW